MPTKRNRPFAAIVPLANVDRETLALSTHPGFLALIEKSRRQVAAGKPLSFEQKCAAVTDPAPEPEVALSTKRRRQTSSPSRRPKTRRASRP